MLQLQKNLRRLLLRDWRTDKILFFIFLFYPNSCALQLNEYVIIKP